jgi:hypothetical protein
MYIVMQCMPFFRILWLFYDPESRSVRFVVLQRSQVFRLPALNLAEIVVVVLVFIISPKQRVVW